MKIKRAIFTHLETALQPGKVMVLYGPRQVGKTTLAKDLLTALPLRSKLVNADEL